MLQKLYFIFIVSSYKVILLCLQMLKRSLYFLKHTKKFLNNWVQLGHDTCHRTNGYDAQKCHQDCKKKEKGSFAQQCRKDGGLFKCCIRFFLFIFHAGAGFYKEMIICIFQARQGVLSRMPLLLYSVSLHHCCWNNLLAHKQNSGGTSTHRPSFECSNCYRWILN